MLAFRAELHHSVRQGERLPYHVHSYSKSVAAICDNFASSFHNSCLPVKAGTARAKASQFAAPQGESSLGMSQAARCIGYQYASSTSGFFVSCSNYLARFLCGERGAIATHQPRVFCVDLVLVTGTLLDKLNPINS
jgi:hypothetical protein